jgi:hypothetical protein
MSDWCDQGGMGAQGAYALEIAPATTSGIRAAAGNFAPSNSTERTRHESVSTDIIVLSPGVIHIAIHRSVNTLIHSLPKQVTTRRARTPYASGISAGTARTRRLERMEFFRRGMLDLLHK